MNNLFSNLINNSNKNINSFIILKKTQCVRQISDTIFDNTRDFVDKDQVYDAELLIKKNKKCYLYLGFDPNLEYEIYIPVEFTSSTELNVMKLHDYQKEDKYFNEIIR